MLSIVIPALNEGRRLLDCVERLESVERIDEVIVVDASDGQQTDDVLDLLAGRPGVTLINCVEKGRAVQMNAGAAACAGDTIVFLHCDTVLPRDAAARIKQCLAGASWGRFNVRLDAPGWRFRLIETMMNLRSRCTRIATGDQAIFIDRTFFLQQGGFAEVALMEDIEFSRRVGRLSPPGLANATVVTSARRWIKHGTWRTILLMWKLRLLYRLGVSTDKLAAMYREAR